MRPNGWDRKFDAPIPGAEGKPLATLRDAAQYMVARIAMMKASQRHEPKAAPAPRRKPAKAYEPLLISTEVGVFRDSTGKVCTDERNALAFPNLGLLPS